MKKFLILDANSIVNRAFYAVRPLTTKEGFHTNALFGFLNILFKYQEEIKPDYIAAAFDLPAPTFRHKMFDGYKATRKKMPEELAEQMPVLKELLTAMNITIFEKEGYEADDIIGTAARVCTEEGVKCCVLTGDRDDLQLASDCVNIHLVTTRMGVTSTEVFDDKKVEEKYGVTPKAFIDLKAIMGDTSDNIPGVKGIGEKGATALIQEFGSVDGVYANLESEKIKGAMRTKLTVGKDDAYMSLQLATIDRHVPITMNIGETEVTPYNNDALFSLFTKLEFRSFLKKLNITPVKMQEKSASLGDIFENVTFETVTDKERLKTLLKTETLFFLYEEEQKNIAFATDTTHAYCADAQLFADVWNEGFKNVTHCCTHGLKQTLLQLKPLGILVENVDFDTEIGAYLLAPARKTYGITELGFEFLGVSLEDDANNSGQISLEGLMAEQSNVGFMKKVILLQYVKQYEQEKMEVLSLTSLFSEMEMPLVYVLASMEEEGFTVDKARLQEFGKMLSEEQTRLTEEIYGLAGSEFNINSPKQLGVVLFEHLGLTAKKKTKSGYSTNAEVLEKLRGEHPIIDKILEYRKIAKLNSTYVEGLMAVIDKADGKVHTRLHQTVTVTGRISSAEPNLQNIPVRTELGREMRKMFVAQDKNHILVDADYSQIELRVLAHLAQDKNMIDAFCNGYDIHAATAAKIFGVAPEAVTGEMRSASKAINFGLVYGMGEFSLSQDLNISVKEAKRYMDDYLGSYPNVKKFMHDTVENAKNTGVVTTMFGRRRELPELSSSNYQVRTFGERAAMNAPVQGTAADIIKLAMVAVYKRLKAEALDAHLILQVHDELIIETTKENEEQVCQILREEMEAAASLLVPLKVDMHTGYSWYDTK